MRKWSLLLILVWLCTSMSFASAVGIQLDGEDLIFSESTGMPFIDENNRVLVPFRLVLEQIGATVQWNSQSRLAVAYKEGVEIIVPIDQTYILRNGEKVVNDTYARIVNGRTYLPIRIVMEAFDYQVGWDAENQKVLIGEIESGETEPGTEVITPELPLQEANIIGNSNGNLHNGGIIAKEFDTLYYVNFEDSESIYSYNTVTLESEKLTERAARKLNVVDGVLYFLEENNNNTWDAYSMNVDGSSKEQIGSSNVSYIGAFESGVYFYNVPEKTLYFYDYEKPYPEEVVEETMNDIQLIDGYAYYVEMDEDDEDIPNAIIRVDLDTLERKTVLEERIGETDSCIVMNDAYIFYCNYNDALTLYRVDIDGDNKTKVSDDHIYDVNATDDKIYYLNPYYDEGIVELMADGTEREKVLSDWHTGTYYDPLISYLDGSLYFRKKTTSTGYSLYRLNLKNQHMVKIDAPSDLVD